MARQGIPMITGPHAKRTTPAGFGYPIPGERQGKLQWTPHSFKSYKAMVESEAKRKQGGLGPVAIGNEVWNEKHGKFARRNDFSETVRKSLKGS
jgi:hypothetical protein